MAHQSSKASKDKHMKADAEEHQNHEFSREILGDSRPFVPTKIHSCSETVCFGISFSDCSCSAKRPAASSCGASRPRVAAKSSPCGGDGRARSVSSRKRGPMLFRSCRQSCALIVSILALLNIACELSQPRDPFRDDAEGCFAEIPNTSSRHDSMKKL